MTIQEIHIIFRGRVQGVGFRWTIEDHAAQLGLKGFTRNLSDGTVEVCAQGSKEMLQTFLEAIKKNPGSASIQGVVSEFRKVSTPMTEFRIVH